MTNLREVRKCAGLSQTQAAEIWHRSQSQVARIEGLELGRIKLNTLCEYVEALGGTVHVTVHIGDQEICL